MPTAECDINAINGNADEKVDVAYSQLHYSRVGAGSFHFTFVEDRK